MDRIQAFQKNVQENDLILVYFFGLSCHVDERNYLLPVGDSDNGTDSYFEDNGNDAERILNRLVEDTHPSAVVFIFDCCRSYKLKNDVVSNLPTKGNGLIKMEIPSGTFVQFVCSENETVDDDLFFKYLLRNIDRQNIHIADLFREITEDVYHQRRRKQKPFYEANLLDTKSVYLNQVEKEIYSPANIQKHALIIGNDKYSSTKNRLTDAISNTRKLDHILHKIKFTVMKHENLSDEDEIMKQVKNFTKTFNNGDVILCYFSGHALQFNGNNYLIPTNDTAINSDEDVEIFGVNVKRILDRLIENKPDCVFVLVLDCCRPYILSRVTGNTHQGLHRMNVPDGRNVFIQFSCTANETTTDDLFNKHLLRNIDRENVSIPKIFQDIVEDVYRQRRQRLRPYFTSTLSEDEPIYLNKVRIVKSSPNNIQKYAFIIGNDKYAREENRLTSSLDTLEKLDDTLQDINFTVTRCQNVKEEDEMMKQVISFTKTFRNGDRVIFYYSGHACQYDANNYLIPTNDSIINKDQDIEVFGIDIERIIDRLIESKPDCILILILDCCRPYPLSRGSTGGLKTMYMPNGRNLFIQFSCAANETTNDDLFNKHLLRNINRANVSINDIFYDIVEDVYRQRRRRLRPYSTSRLPEDETIYLNEVRIIGGPPAKIQKHALIIENDDYSRSENKITDPINNATKLAHILQKINFTVTKQRNLADENDMIEKVIDFTKTFNNGDVVLCYFSGHALQFDGNNYLIPTNDTAINSDEDVEVFGVNVKRILDRLIENKPDCVFVLVLDCCRPYTLNRITGNAPIVQNKGLHRMKVPSGRKVFIQFSCAPNQTTKDNLFKKYFLLHIQKKNLPVDEIFHDIAKSVCRRRRQQLQPYSKNELPDDEPVYFNFGRSLLPNIPLNAVWKSNALTIMGDCYPGSTFDRLRSPQGISISKNGSLLIADSSNHRIMKYNLHTGIIQKIAGKNMQGYGPDLLAKPSNIIFHSQTKSFIICDAYNRRIFQKFLGSTRRDRTLLENIGCFGVATDINGDLYVSDTEQHEVRRYRIGSKYAKVVAGGNGQGSRLKQLNHPTYICIGDDFSVYVSDSWNNRVVKWKRNANEGIIVAGGQGRGKTREQLDYPAGVLVDRLGTIYVADHRNHRIMRWRKNEEPDIIAGDRFRSGDDAKQLTGPEGLAFDREGNLYVADSNNHRIQRFKIRTP